MGKFFDAYGGEHRNIRFDSPELKFLSLLTEGKTDAAISLFTPTTYSGAPAWIDAPQGKFEGDEIHAFAEGWFDGFDAVRGEILPAVQTTSAGRSVTELEFAYDKKDGSHAEIPMAAIADLRPDGKMESFRLYFNFKFDRAHFNAYRAPVFESNTLTPIDNTLLTGTVREYFEALHTYPHADVERILRTVNENGCRFGGYSPDEDPTLQSMEELRIGYERMASYIPLWLYIRIQTVIDDGINCVVEWQHLITREGRNAGGRICESGISAYERGADGKLCAIRICDYANCEGEIDWSTARMNRSDALARNLID